MSHKVFATLSLLTLLVAAPVFAEGPLKATIPFDFKMGNHQMTAGQYEIVFDVPNTVLLTRADRKGACRVITTAAQTMKTLEVGKLVFNRYGNSYFLSQVWSGNTDRGWTLRKSKTELEYARIANSAKPEYASVRVAPR